MKRTVLTLITAGLLAAFIPAGGNAADKPMDPAVAQLDLDGDFVLFLNTETIEQRVLEYIDTMFEMMLVSFEGPAPGPGFQQVTEGVNKLKDIIEWSGLLSIDSYAMSTAPVEGTLSRTISIASHSEADADKPLWRLLASEPKALEGKGYAPADSVYMLNGTMDLSEAWDIINEVLTEFLAPEQTAAVNQQIAMAGMMLGTNVVDIIDSIGDEILISIQMSEEKECMIPMGAQPMTMPEPSLIIGLQTRSPLLQQLLLRQLQQAGMPVVESQHDDYTLHTLTPPSPSPFPLAPTLVQTDHYILIGSSAEAITSALDSNAGGSGLTATALYKKLLVDAPAETSSIEFLSPRFMQVYMNFMRQQFADMDAEARPIFEVMFGSCENIYSGAYSLKTPTGIYSRCYADYGGTKPIELITGAYIGAISAAVAIPLMTENKDRAIDTEAQAGCAAIATALRMHWAEHDSFDGIMKPTDLEMLNPGDLDGHYFNDDSYTLESLVDGQNFIIQAQGVGDAAAKRIIMTMVAGESSWDIQ